MNFRSKMNAPCRNAKLHLELLESRLLLAGDTYLINFQNDEATTPSRYLRDTGETFAVRTSGLSYGWSSDHIDQGVERSTESDQRLDTLIQVEAGQQWQFALENGQYEVTLAVGDPANNDAVHTANIEGVNFFSAVADVSSAMTVTQVVTVTDGMLTLDVGSAGEGATRVNYMIIVGVPSGMNSAPELPTVTEPATAGQVVNPFDVHMEAVGFSDLDGDSHKSSDWEIWTVGLGAEPVWQTLGIEGVERLHTHLGDGIFINGLAGETSLAGNTDYELRVRFRDDVGSVSGFATRWFQTGNSSTVFPLELKDVALLPTPTWTTIGGDAIELPATPPILLPFDSIIAIDRDAFNSSYPSNESPSNAIDGTLNKYLNFGELNSGFIVTPTVGSSIVKSFQISTANDAEERDPTAWELYGTNDTIQSSDNSTGSAENWTLIDFGGVSLPGARNAPGPNVEVTNSTAYTSYRMVFTGVKNAAAANSMQIAEIQFFGDFGGGSSSTSELWIESAAGMPLLQIQADVGPGNTIINPQPLAGHAEVRVRVQAGSGGLSLPNSDLRFTDDQGITRTIYLPEITLAAEEEAAFWISLDGSSYFGQVSQMEPDFSLIARPANLDVPFIATLPGFVVEEVGVDYRLPVNIAFVPNPGTNPNDPLYYVTELYGSIQVVTRDGTKHEFATGLLDYNPTGPISGSGEQGLTGIAVMRDEADPDVYHLFVGMLWDNGSPPGNSAHYPKVERITSTVGGLSLASRTVLLNMQPEVQGQSHQISNITIGPDGKLYVHNGDGFNPSTAQNLDQYRGKVLRMNLDGSAPTDNPFYDASNGINARDFVFAYGLRNPFGGAWRAADGKHYSVENGPSIDRMSQINAGVNYGWDGSTASMQINAIYNWDPAHAPVNITFVQPETFGGSALPAELQDMAFVSESGPTYASGAQTNGKRIVGFALDANGDAVSGPTSLIEYVGFGRSSVVGLAPGPDGLYFTELYEESGDSGPTSSGARIFRVRYVGGEPGDFDIDGDVDNNDLGRWQSGFGTSDYATASIGDADEDADVDGSDFLLWQRNHVAPATVSVFTSPQITTDSPRFQEQFEVGEHYEATELALLAQELGWSSGYRSLFEIAGRSYLSEHMAQKHRQRSDEAKHFAHSLAIDGEDRRGKSERNAENDSPKFEQPENGSSSAISSFAGERLVRSIDGVFARWSGRRL